MALIERLANVSVGVKLGHRGDVRCITALPPKADIDLRSCYVAEVPISDIVPVR
jgi:hypothetical protein